MSTEFDSQALTVFLERALEEVLGEMEFEEIKCLDWFTCDTDEFIAQKYSQVA